MFDLSLSDEQDQLRSTCRSLFRREGDMQLVREAEPLGFSASTWRTMSELGLVEMALPEALGGSGAGVVDLALVGEVVGEFLAPVPLVECSVATRVLAAIDDSIAREYTAAASGGTPLVTIALTPPSAGLLRWVAAGAIASAVVFRDGDAVFMVSGPPSHRALDNLGSLPVAHRSIEGARLLGRGPEAAAAFSRGVVEWRTLTAAMIVGAGMRALEMGVAYTKSREAFGVPIASFQAIAHRLADLATSMQGAQLLARKAAWACDARPDDAMRLGTMAYFFAGETAEQVALDVLHFHGGYGFMLEYDIQLYLRRIKAWSNSGGDPQRRLAEIADSVFGPACATAPMAASRT